MKIVIPNQGADIVFPGDVCIDQPDIAQGALLGVTEQALVFIGRTIYGKISNCVAEAVKRALQKG